MTQQQLPDPSSMTYNEALAELEKIMTSLRSDSCDVDALVAMTRRAAAILEACRSRLTATERELAQTLSQLEAE